MECVARLGVDAQQIRTLGERQTICSRELGALGLQLKGADPHSVWKGDGIAPGGVAGILLRFVVGLLTITFYLTALRALGCFVGSIRGAVNP
ncbi:MAG TPA: hypothetical protein VH477_14770 [Bryobacteraceae bacterium]|jgi:hypothetical protein